MPGYSAGAGVSGPDEPIIECGSMRAKPVFNIRDRVNLRLTVVMAIACICPVGCGDHGLSGDAGQEEGEQDLLHEAVGDEGEEEQGQDGDDREDAVEDAADTQEILDQVYVAGGNPYEMGGLTVGRTQVEQGQSGAPVPIILFYPLEPGTYAVVVFQHGFLMAAAYYSEILTHLASQGFIVAAPQMYEAGGLPIGKPSTPEEAALAVQVLEWIRVNVSAFAGVTARTDLLGYAGHSRGGKVSWLLLKQDSSRARAVAGVDPVDGTGGPMGGEERIIQGPFDFPFPSLVLGTGLGPVSSGPLQPACAPEGDNHVQFYDASASPAWHVVATEQGHLDMLDAATPGCGMECSACPAGPDRAGMRLLTGGLLAAFFRGSLQGDGSAYVWLLDTAAAPIPALMESK
jgi:chlorophyllase